MFDEIREFFRKQIDKMFFGDNTIISVSETAMDFANPDDTVTEIVVEDSNGDRRTWRITEVK